MNAITPIVSERASAVARMNRDAFLSLAWKQSRLSWRYRKWALEDSASGDLNAYRKHAAEALRLWRDAQWHLDYARNITNG